MSRFDRISPFRFYLSCVILTLAAFLLSAASWQDVPLDVDPVNFHMAISEYSVVKDRPHPPGYPVYVALGKLCSAVIGTDHAFRLVVTVAWCLTGFFLAVSTFRICGTLSSILAQVAWFCNPLTFANITGPETYVFEGLYFGLVVFIATSRLRQRWMMIWMVLLMGIMGLVRPTAVIYMAPAMVVAMLSLGSARPRVVICTILAGLLVWFGLQQAFIVGVVGRADYAGAVDRVMGGAFSGYSTLGGAALGQHLRGVAKLSGWVIVAAIPCVAMLILLRPWRTWGLMPASSRRAILVAVAGIVFPIAFFALIYYLKPLYLAGPIAGLSFLIGVVAGSRTRLRDSGARGTGPDGLLEGTLEAIDAGATSDSLDRRSASPVTSYDGVRLGLAACSVMFPIVIAFLPTSWLPGPLGRLTLDYARGVTERFDEIREEAQTHHRSGVRPVIVFFGTAKISPYLGRLIENAELVSESDGMYYLYNEPLWLPAPEDLVRRIVGREGVVFVR